MPQSQYQKDWIAARPEKRREYAQRHNKKKREWIEKFKSEHPCTDCGESDAVVLEFDHVPERGPKMSYISATRGVGKDKLLVEMAKCDVVCANCHTRRTKARGQNDGQRRQNYQWNQSRLPKSKRSKRYFRW